MENIFANPFLITILSGLVAALVSIYYHSKEAKKQIVLSLVQMYLEKAKLRAHVAWVFSQCATDPHCKCIYPQESADENVRLEASKNRNQFIELGDWFEVVASLYASNSLNNYLIDVTGLLGEVRDFREQIQKIRHPKASEFKKFWPCLYSQLLK
jgi:hypothetical protein